MNWTKAETEYVTGECSYRFLACKFGVSLSVLANYAKEHNWTDKRSDFRNKTITEAVRKSEALISDNNAAIAANLSESARLMSERLLKELQPEKEIKPFNLAHYAGVWKVLYDALPKEQADAETETGGIIKMPEQTDGDEGQNE